ncbi:MAG TPA: response regulator transcription factor [Gaiellaceae bacterium]|nr:response regulator transcription factor [Gaiellaceae bacterium]
MSGQRILVVDDDTDIRALLRELLERRGFSVAEAADGRQALQELYGGRPDLVLLDVGMPGMDGWTTLERIRELSDVPVVMLTARSAELEKTRGLRAGADDYVTKPFGRQELLARIEGLLRRSGGRDTAVAESYSDAFVTIDFAQRQVTARGRPVELTPLEFKLLTAFVRHPNQVLSNEQLLVLVWGDSDASREQVKLYVGYLRRKLSPDAPDEAPIETRRGFGYAYRPRRGG